MGSGWGLTHSLNCRSFRAGGRDGDVGEVGLLGLAGLTGLGGLIPARLCTWHRRLIEVGLGGNDLIGKLFVSISFGGEKADEGTAKFISLPTPHDTRSR